MFQGRPTGCHSAVGRRGGRQALNLQPNEPGVGCFRLGTIAHEFLHALGFYHQQSTSDRDNYVDIIWRNIDDGIQIVVFLIYTKVKYEMLLLVHLKKNPIKQQNMAYWKSVFLVSVQLPACGRSEMKSDYKAVIVLVS